MDVDLTVSSDSVCFQRTALGVEIESDPRGTDSTPPPIRNFADMTMLPPWMNLALIENKWDDPMPIQAQALPILLSGRNLIGIAQTGSGKTIAFLIPAVVHANDQRRLTRTEPGPVVLVLAPTRELAVQIGDEAVKLLRHSHHSKEHQGGLRSQCFYGGGKKRDQLMGFTAEGSHIVVATPGRLLDFLREGKVGLHRVTYLCLDEADRMLDMGFRGDMEEIGSAIRPERQTAFFSATWPREVQSLAFHPFADAPVTIRVRKAGQTSNGADDGELLAREGIVQEVVVIDEFEGQKDQWEKQEEYKRSLLEAHITKTLENGDQKIIIFVNQKTFADELSEKLWNKSIYCDALHGGKRQDDRLYILEKFRKGQINCLIATDVLGRGLDIPKVTHVVVYNLGSLEDYIHRIGRTGRGKDGRGHSLTFFEYNPNRPDAAKELISVLERSNQEVPPKLVDIAKDVAAGKREANWSAGDWSRGQWGSRNSSADQWKRSDWQSSDRKSDTAPSGGVLPEKCITSESISNATFLSFDAAGQGTMIVLD